MDFIKNSQTWLCKIDIMDDCLITEIRNFVADHYHSKPGFQEPRHGHNWKIEATVEKDELIQLGSIMDIWTEQLDYSLLNDQADLLNRNPTAEVIAEHLFHYLEAVGLKIVEVRAREKTRYWAACCPDTK